MIYKINLRSSNKLISNLLLFILVFSFILSFSGCIDLAGPISGTGTGSGSCSSYTSNNIHFYPLNGQHKPFRNCLDGNIRSCTYKLYTNNICVSENANANISVLVDSSAVIEGLVVTGVAASTSMFMFYTRNLNVTRINNFNNTGQSKFTGDAVLFGFQHKMKSTGCDLYATVEFPTKGSEQQDLNYLYSKVYDVYIEFNYNKYN